MHSKTLTTSAEEIAVIAVRLHPGGETCVVEQLRVQTWEAAVLACIANKEALRGDKGWVSKEDKSCDLSKSGVWQWTVDGRVWREGVCRLSDECITEHICSLRVSSQDEWLTWASSDIVCDQTSGHKSTCCLGVEVILQGVWVSDCAISSRAWDLGEDLVLGSHLHTVWRCLQRATRHDDVDATLAWTCCACRGVGRVGGRLSSRRSQLLKEDKSRKG